MARLLIHPGEHLANELEALGISANQLAKELGVPTDRITEIIRGKRGPLVTKKNLRRRAKRKPKTG